jgi:FdrA protein
VTARKFELFPDAYVDSVVQLSATRAMGEVDAVEWAAAAMGTPANLKTLSEYGFGPDDTGKAPGGSGGSPGITANDCFIAVVAGSEEAAAEAAAAGQSALFGGAKAKGGPAEGGGERPAPRSLDEAVSVLGPAATVAIVSVPGDYAALEAHKALSAGLHVLLFSDNVPVEDEIELKARAEELGLLVMGPGAGTAMLGGTGLGFANALSRRADRRPGVAVVAAAGTGAQEAMALLDRWGAPVSHVIGVGGRDLTEAVGGRMARMAVRALRDDPATSVVLLVSKPPAESAAKAVLAEAGGDLPVVACLLGLSASIPVPDGVRLATTLEGGVMTTLEVLWLPPPDPTEGLRERVEASAGELSAERTLIRGLFSGGTLCYESLVILSRLLGPVHSNTPLRPGWDLPAPPGSHVCLDLGEEEYTKGRPHPMIDPEARIEVLRQEGAAPEVAAVLLDIVLGHGAHADPAGRLAPVCAEIHDGGRGPVVVAYVLGTDSDAQGLEAQRATLAEAGCLVAPTAARASLAAAALAARRPELVDLAAT